MSGSDSHDLQGPDLAAGIDIDRLGEGQPFLGHAHGEAVVLVRRGDACFALGATCTHYSGPLAEGLVEGDTIRCPWHHARFDLGSGAPRGGPGINPLPCYEVVRQDRLVRIGAKKAIAASARAGARRGPERIVIIGSGPAGALVADTLRAEGHTGSIKVVGDEGFPVDRPNLSKDYLAGTAPEEWLPLRDAAAWQEKQIELVSAHATAIDVAGKRVQIAGGPDLGYDALVIATGAAPIRLPIPGADLPHVHLLRTLADSRAIIAAVTAGAKRAVVIGGGFIGLEAAAALRARNLDVTVVLRETVPLDKVLGPALGAFVERLHGEHGVAFVRDTTAAIDRSGPGSVTLASGKKLDADLVVMGVGVRPRVELGAAAGLRTDNGIVVDDRLRTSAPDVFAVGDVARFPWGRDGALVRVEHFVHAERMGFVAARNLLGDDQAFRLTPFFWSQHYDVPIAYVGAGPWDDVQVIGDPAKRDVLAVYRKAGRAVALASIYRDRESLQFEALLERGDDPGIEALVRAAAGA
jgi:NADPH-dependent 2,4-dienoyl-CoA reductase/sulfur reductase-like enzyme/nitrite reductase/ring-hydroxylating ferredoxin subunit